MEDLMMHGQDYAGQDVSGWYATEKLDGCRARWDGAQLWSRTGKLVKAPPGMLAELPPGFAIDGELYAGPGTRCAVAAAMRTGRWPDRVRFVAFDAPDAPGDYPRRISAVRALWPGRTYFEVVPALRISDIDTARHLLRAINQVGGEGLMLYQPDRPYTPARVPSLLKLKDYL
jgi:DNA ligase-1